MNEFNRLPKWLAQKISDNGITVEHLGWKAKVSRGSIYYYLNGTVKPTTQAMGRICRVLGISLEEALRQYSPSTIGRPVGSSNGVRAVRTRSR